MRPINLLVALAVLASVAACNRGLTPSPIASGPIALPGERPASPSLATPPDEWAAPPRQTAQAATAGH
jgi:hypothetical protein